MPGGSVNGRPFRDSPNSYSRCGVPCGHPDRYSTSSVVRVGVSAFPRGRVTLDGPMENIETEGERQLKQLAKRQTETKLNLQEHISRHRAFTEKVVYKPKTAELQGVKTLEDYNQIRRQDDELEFLRQCGLSESEIKYKRTAEAESSQDVDEPPEKQQKYGVHPQVKTEVLQNIQEKIDDKKRQFSNPDTFSGAVHISRHEMELENSLNSNRSQSRFLNCLITTKKEDNVAADHPINQLQEILTSITKPKNRKKKKKKNPTADERSSEFEKSDSQSTSISSNIDDIVQPCEENPDTTLLPVNPIAKEEIIRCRLSREEIGELERFKDYQPGNVSHVLYIKNLSKKVTHSDLASLFVHFQKDSLPPTIKLLKGKMRGQAFVTFDDSDTATEALDLIHGYMLKGQPVIIQYGKVIST